MLERIDAGCRDVGIVGQIVFGIETADDVVPDERRRTAAQWRRAARPKPRPAAAPHMHLPRRDIAAPGSRRSPATREPDIKSIALAPS